MVKVYPKLEQRASQSGQKMKHSDKGKHKEQGTTRLIDEDTLYIALHTKQGIKWPAPLFRPLQLFESSLGPYIPHTLTKSFAGPWRGDFR